MGLKLEPTERHYNNAPDMASGALEVSNEVEMLKDKFPELVNADMHTNQGDSDG